MTNDEIEVLLREVAITFTHSSGDVIAVEEMVYEVFKMLCEVAKRLPERKSEGIFTFET